ncbi:hypothetical protein ACHAWO_001323 [Cyclotella atomus]|jgi:gamma-glutamylcyclotransferase (GGCT)/AIG2-like uncharacterized protein YtfP|uniref:Gamma-glutamylcyclotransferase AIG2-like domain-containing protein n=1 Tax=Cyclotella atomus TaxID=382360 RepID=A0ABD3PQZ0_9STRA
MIKYVFVYGSLRPDDDSAQPWTRDAVAGMIAEKARLPRAKLYHDRYACVVLESLEDRSKTKTSLSDSYVHGYVLSTSDKEMFKQKLSLFDRIEGYNGPGSLNLYDRTVVDVELESRTVMAYVYHGSHRCSKRNLIPSGDWLQRT